MIALSALADMTFPAISAIKANRVAASEQGAVQVCHACMCACIRHLIAVLPLRPCKSFYVAMRQREHSQVLGMRVCTSCCHQHSGLQASWG